MKIVDGKIVECTKDELFDYWLKRYSEILSFRDYKFRMESVGVIVKEEPEMKKVFVSVPMRGLKNEEIQQAIVKLHQIAEILEGQQLELVHNFDSEAACETRQDRLHCVAKAIDKLADCDLFIGVDSYSHNGCDVERHAATAYGIKDYMLSYREVFGKREEEPALCCEGGEKVCR